MPRQSLIREFLIFLREEKKWWMIPLIAVLLLVGTLAVLMQSSSFAAFLYPLF